MHLFTSGSVPENYRNSIIAIGNFDGVHIGHKKLISSGIELARKKNKKLGIITFEPHPISLFLPDRKNYRLTPAPLKAKILANLGVDFLININFDESFAKITAKDFIRSYIVEGLSADTVITGKDFIFGAGRKGNFETLQQFSKTHNFDYLPYEIVEKDNIKYSSTSAREALKNGNLTEYKNIIDKNYIISGKVIEGRKEGRKIGYPTANIDFGEFVIPKFGVYSCSTKIDNEYYNSIANIGIRPTFEQKIPLLEVHIPDFSKDIYGKELEVELLNFIREEKKFNSAEELKAQIEKDIKYIK